MTESIFIVDDDEGHVELIQSNLRRAGISNSIVTFANGFEILDAIFEAGNEPDLPLLILLDLNMPGMHGTKVLERLRKEERTKSVPIVILTTSANTPEVDECYRLGCNLYLVKPIRYEHFVKVIRSLGLMIKIVRMPNSTESAERETQRERALNDAPDLETS